MSNISNDRSNGGILGSLASVLRLSDAAIARFETDAITRLHLWHTGLPVPDWYIKTDKPNAGSGKLTAQGRLRSKDLFEEPGHSGDESFRPKQRCVLEVD